MKRLLTMLFPALSRFDDWTTAMAVLDEARKEEWGRPWFLLLTFIAIPAMVFLLSFVPWITGKDLASSALRMALLLSIGFLYIALLTWLSRRSIQRSLWRKLAARGIPCCMHCGYDLTGNESGVCPECGKALPGRSRPSNGSCLG